MTLPEVAFFPTVMMPLFIFEPRYRSMLKTSLEGNRMFAVAGIDPTLEGAVERARDRIDRTLTKLRSQGAAAIARRDEVIAGQFGRLRAHLLPDGVPQERRLSPYSSFLKFGIRPVLALFETLPISGRHDLEIV